MSNSNIIRQGLEAALDAASRSAALVGWNGKDMLDQNAGDAYFELAVAMGKCRLFSVIPQSPQLHGTLDWPMAELALRTCCVQAAKEHAQVTQLDERVEESATMFETHDACLAILERRLELEACRRAILDTRDEEATVSTPPPTLFESRLGQLDYELELLDEQIAEYGGLISIAAETFWPSNVISALDANLWQPLPWWLTDDLVSQYEDYDLIRTALKETVLPDVFELSVANTNTAFLSRLQNPVPADVEYALQAHDGQTQSEQIVKYSDTNEQVTVTFRIDSKYLDWNRDQLQQVEEHVVKIILSLSGDIDDAETQFWQLSTETFDMILTATSGSGSVSVPPSAITEMLISSQWPTLILTRVG